MSLIGDALKRTQQNTTPPRPRPQAQPQSLRKPAVAPVAAPAETSRNLLMVVLVCVFVVGGIGLYGLRQLYSMFAANAKAVAQVSSMETAPPPVAKQPPKAPEPIVSPAPLLPEPVKEIVTGAKVAMPKAEPAAPPAPPPTPTPRALPKLVLQGVTISGGLREALINGQTVGVGDEVDGAKVISIERMKVKMTFDSREFTLGLY